VAKISFLWFAKPFEEVRMRKEFDVTILFDIIDFVEI